uniref:Putative secreted protein n=1 Tax=Ixodes ricinus TaxID=34613 RepID=A0A6B0UMY6_IXORI
MWSIKAPRKASSFSASCCLCLRLSSEAFLASIGAEEERASAPIAATPAPPPVAPVPGAGEDALLRRELGIPFSDGREKAAAAEAPVAPSEDVCGFLFTRAWQLPSSLAPQSQKKEPNLA